MIGTTTRGGGGITVGDRIEISGTDLDRLGARIGELSADGTVGDFDLGTLLTQVPAPLTALNLDAARVRYHQQLALVLAELEATVLAIRTAALAYREAEKGVSEVFGGLLDGLGYATGRLIAISLPVIIPAAIAVGVPAVAGWQIIDATGLDGVVEQRPGLDRGPANAELTQDLVPLVFENSDATGAVIEHVLPGMVVGFLGLPPGLLAVDSDTTLWPHDSGSMTAWVLAAANLVGLLTPSEVEVWKAQGLTQPHTRPPADVAELYDREAAQHRGVDSGQVRIEEVRSPDGTTRYIVYVPATTDWSPVPGENTTDLTTNVEGMAGNDTVMREMVRRAIADAGIPDDAEVMLVGYSQGGITAGSLAADPAFLADVNVTALVTVGAPVSDFPIDEGIDVLSIEHEQDLVPDLDGNENPVRDRWSTITVDYDPDALRQAPNLADRSDKELDDMFDSAGAAHSSAAYSASIGLMVAAGHPALRGFTARNAQFFSGRITETRDYQGRRRRS